MLETLPPPCISVTMGNPSYRADSDAPAPAESTLGSGVTVSAAAGGRGDRGRATAEFEHDSRKVNSPRFEIRHRSFRAEAIFVDFCIVCLIMVSDGPRRKIIGYS